MKSEIMMELSDEQMGAAMHGLGGEPSWEPIELPVGRRTLPDWLLGAHVDLMIDYANSPRVKLKIGRDPWPAGESVLYDYEGDGAWVARSSDGWLMRRYHHRGAIRQCMAWRVVRSDQIVTNGMRKDGWCISDGDAKIAAEKHLEFCRRQYVQDGLLERADEYRIEYMEVLASDKSGGFGGSHYHLKMIGGTIEGGRTVERGTTVVLRGPWHGGSPVGWADVTMVNMSDEYNRRPLVHGGRTWPWHSRGGSFGYYVSEELILLAVARFEPHMFAAKVYPGYGHAHVEFYDASWGAPKMFAAERRSGWGAAK